MIKKTTVKFKDGSAKTQIRVVKSVREGKNTNPKQVTIKTFGYLEDQTNLDDFWKEVNTCNSNMLQGHKRKIDISPIDLNKKNNDVSNRELNYGYRFIESILEKLEVKELFDDVEFRGTYSLYDVFSFLIYQRILNPSSKRNSYQEIERFYDKQYTFSLDNVYRALDKFSDISIKLQTHLNSKIKELIGRDKSYAFYDVTNYFFERDFNAPMGEYQQKGVSKEHRLNPIIQLGLFMDSNNLPIAMKTFPGNTSDSITLKPSLNDIKNEYSLGRLIVVADKGLNSTKNIDYITSNGDGYVVSQILKGPKGSRYHDIMFDENGYEGDEDFRYKLFEEDYETHITSKKVVKRRRKVLIYWSKEDAAYAKAKRDCKVELAEKNLSNNVYSESTHNNVSGNAYVVKQYFNKDSGEMANKEIRGVDYDKVNEDEKFDGYFCIITSELNYDYKKILEVYRNLWHIEESFRITKTDLRTRPIYVRTRKHLEGHMLTCFVSLLVLRLLQLKMDDKKISVERIQTVLNKCNCKSSDENYIDLTYVGGKYSFTEKISQDGRLYTSLKLDKENDEIRNDYLKIIEMFDIDLDRMKMRSSEFRNVLNKIKYKYKKA